MSFLKKVKVGILALLLLTLASANAADKVYKINVAFGNQIDEPLGQLATKWKELAEEKSNGQIELIIYPSSQLGAEKDVVEQASLGNNVLIFTGYDYLMDYVPDIGILNGPYLTENFDQLIYLTTTDWFKEIKEKLRAQNIEIVNANTVYGARELLTNKKVTNPDDLKGMKIRVPQNQMSIKIFDAMGAAATPYPLGELYTALQQGLVDGAENPLPVLYGTKAQEVSKYLALTHHQRFIAPWVAGTKFIQTLPEELVEILKETGDEAAQYARGVLEEETQEMIETFKSQGVEITEVDIKPFQEKTVKVYSEFPRWTPNLYENIQKLVEEQ